MGCLRLSFVARQGPTYPLGQPVFPMCCPNKNLFGLVVKIKIKKSTLQNFTRRRCVSSSRVKLSRSSDERKDGVRCLLIRSGGGEVELYNNNWLSRRYGLRARSEEVTRRWRRGDEEKCYGQVRFNWGFMIVFEFPIRGNTWNKIKKKNYFHEHVLFHFMLISLLERCLTTAPVETGLYILLVVFVTLSIDAEIKVTRV